MIILLAISIGCGLDCCFTYILLKLFIGVYIVSFWFMFNVYLLAFNPPVILMQKAFLDFFFKEFILFFFFKLFLGGQTEGKTRLWTFKWTSSHSDWGWIACQCYWRQVKTGTRNNWGVTQACGMRSPVIAIFYCSVFFQLQFLYFNWPVYASHLTSFNCLEAHSQNNAIRNQNWLEGACRNLRKTGTQT